MLLNADQILAAEDKTVKKVAVPEWGEGAKVLVGTMGALARARMDDWIKTLGSSSAAEPETAAGQASESEELITCDDADPNPSEESAGEPKAATAAEREYTSEENTAVMVRWCGECILDPKTKRRAFTDDRVEALGQKSPAALLRIYKAAVEINLATAESAKAFEKNSERTSGGSSGGD
jgi:hypothetical protein